MSKKFDFEVVTYTTDQIEEMNMDDLYKNINRVKRTIKEANKLGQETQEHEVEFCYLDHERQMRYRHDNFVRQNRKSHRSNK